MPQAKDKKKSKAVVDLTFVGDASFILNEDFTVEAVLRVDESYLQEATGMHPGVNFFSCWRLKAEPEEVCAACEKNGKWENFFNFNNKFILVELHRNTAGKLTMYQGYLKVARVQPVSMAQQNQFPMVPYQVPGVLYQSKSLQKDLPIHYQGSIFALTGYTEADLNELPGKYLSIVYSEDVSIIMKMITDINLEYGKKSEEVIYRLVKRDGTIIWVKENVLVTKDPSTKKALYQGLITDITKLREYENKLLESEAKLVENNQSKDRFINILSHDLRAPFTSILGFSEILLNETNLSIQEKNEYLTYIYEASQNQLQFIGYLLDWSRLRTGGLKIEPQRLRVQAVVYNVVSILTGNAIRKNINIQVDIGDNLYVQADERLLTQVVLNLLSNAIKFSNENQFIEISAGIFNDTHVEIIVKDHGVGIPWDDQSKIFSIDKNYSKEGTKGEKGSGFGLALVKEIIAKHSGEIWFYSEPEKGTEFHFTLPLPSNSLLVVTDNDDDRQQIIELIRRNFPEFSISAAENGYEAISTLAQQVPNVIITAHSMPLMTGLQLIEAIKRGDADMKLPSLIIGNNISQETEMHYFRLGVRAIFQKPFDAEEFVNALRMILL